MLLHSSHISYFLALLFSLRLYPLLLDIISTISSNISYILLETAIKDAGIQAMSEFLKQDTVTLEELNLGGK
jgi:hypothetical protein